MSEPVDDPLLAAIATVKHVARMAVAILFVFNVRERRRLPVVVPTGQHSVHRHDLIAVTVASPTGPSAISDQSVSRVEANASKGPSIFLSRVEHIQKPA